MIHLYNFIGGNGKLGQTCINTDVILYVGTNQAGTKIYTTINPTTPIFTNCKIDTVLKRVSSDEPFIMLHLIDDNSPILIPIRSIGMIEDSLKNGDSKRYGEITMKPLSDNDKYILTTFDVNETSSRIMDLIQESMGNK